MASSGDGDDPPALSTIRVQVRNLRLRLAPHGLPWEIVTKACRGYAVVPRGSHAGD